MQRQPCFVQNRISNIISNIISKSILSRLAPSLLTGLLALSSGCGRTHQTLPQTPSHTTEAWDRPNTPQALDPFMKTTFDRTLLSASLKNKIPWSDDYWQSNKAGLARRWLRPTDNPYRYQTFTLAELQSMQPSDIATLSPAEKFDIYGGQTDGYPLVKSQRQNNFASAPDWSGLCHGWAPASLNFDEPKPVSLKGANGITVWFGSSDIKALLTYYQGEVARIHATPPGGFLGHGCGTGEVGECLGVNAGSFHLALTHRVGRLNKGLLVDTGEGKTIWNHPVFAFESKILGERTQDFVAPRAGVVREVTLQTTIKYSASIDPTWEALGPQGNRIKSTVYHMTLELDEAGRITGGHWLDAALKPSATALRPDFVWFKDRPIFLPEWKILEEIYRASTGDMR